VKIDVSKEEPRNCSASAKIVNQTRNHTASAPTTKIEQTPGGSLKRITVSGSKHGKKTYPRKMRHGNAQNTKMAYPVLNPQIRKRDGAISPRVPEKPALEYSMCVSLV
jgi:hypothetical protein